MQLCLYRYLRSYTYEFGMKMAKEILPELHNVESTPPNLIRSQAEKRLQQLWQDQDGLGDTWEDAGLREIAHYLLGAKGLKVPPDWEWIIPLKL